MGVFKRYHESKDGTKTPYWYIRYWVNGREKKEAVGRVGIATKIQARARLEERRRQARLGQYDMIGAHIPTLSEFAGDYVTYARDVVKKRSWKKDEAHLRNWNKAFGSLRLKEITPKHIDDYKLARVKEVKPVTVNR